MKRKPTKPTQPSSKAVEPDTAKPATTGIIERSQPKQNNGQLWLWVVAALIVIVPVALLWQYAIRSQTSPTDSALIATPVSAAQTITATTTITRTAGPIGGVALCRRQPAFTGQIGVSNQSFLSTRDRKIKGLAIIDPVTNNGTVYQHPSWSKAGYLGPFVLDRNGNIYVVPSPRISVLDNPPALQNRLYKIDSTTQELAPYLELPSVALPSLINPYGAMGLAYDCESESLYVSSVAGSDRHQERGRIYRIDLASGKVVAQLDNIDAIGLVVFNGAGGKRLYVGSARRPEVRSVLLDAKGDFVASDQRHEFSLSDISSTGYNRARRINVTRDNEMLLYTMKFNYNLSPSDDTKVATLQYIYDVATGRWVRSKIQRNAGDSAS